ncbi:hypothetical protein [Saccharophagus degradans]|uniref:Uncharacterized protein n=1 Tax=Saccharophagus degradans TaxID=86304 RepID=A0AAW7X7F7_9GAMM|nr:hypothetical protein [Saccharophagus degradans]MDO6423520.1 hypothetical protein [Saccharophagus degradans]MDO6606925.1 hypothetical protein [Saccharophagus degradans]
MKIIGSILFCVAMFVLPIFYLFDCIGVSKFIPLVLVWIFGAVVLYIGPDTINEISYGALSIKRDVKAAKDYKEEAEAIAKSIQELAKLMVENDYILAHSTWLAMEGEENESPRRERIQENLASLVGLVDPLRKQDSEWWKKVEEICSNK